MGVCRNVGQQLVARRLWCTDNQLGSLVWCPLLADRHRRTRLEWCLAQRGWNLRTWRKIHWSDESPFLLHVSDGRMRVWRHKKKPIPQQWTFNDSPWLKSRWFQTVSNCSCWQTSIGQPVLFEYSMVRRRISEAQTWQIIGMHTTVMSFKAIGRQMCYHYTVDSRLVRKHTQTNNELCIVQYTLENIDTTLWKQA
jgi:hypothetical protein